MNVNFNGYNENVVTFETKSSDVVMGTAVKMSESSTVAKCADDEAFAGVALNVRNGYAAVQLSGYIEMPTDDNIEVGYQKLVCASGNKVKVSENGREYLVVYKDTNVVGFIL